MSAKPNVWEPGPDEQPGIFRTNRVTWIKRTGTGYFLAGKMLRIAGMPKGADVGYSRTLRSSLTGSICTPAHLRRR